MYNRKPEIISFSAEKKVPRTKAGRASVWILVVGRMGISGLIDFLI